MMTWTPTAKRELESHLRSLRASLERSGADPEEVLEDLRRHVNEEASAAGLGVVTEADVRRLLARVGTAVAELPSSKPAKPAAESPPPAARRGVWGPWRTFGAWLFGVVLPVVTLVFELFTRVSAQELVDPLPTMWHVLLVLAVPLANAWAILRITASEADWQVSDAWWKGDRGAWLANGVAAGVGLVYTLLFLPVTPLAFVGILFGVGLLALAPLSGFIVALVVRRRLVKRAADRAGLPTPAWWGACAVAVVMLAGLAAPAWWTRHQARIATGEDVDAAHRAVAWLRTWGDRELLLRDCYGRRQVLWTSLRNGPESVELSRELYFRVTGQPFNGVPAPAPVHSRQNRAFLGEWEFDGTEFDAGLGGTAVAGRVRGLSLLSSRMDVIADPDAAWAYYEWILEFRNDHPRTQREARAQVQLPPGGVVSRLTLWVNGEEREAAFSGRSEVRAAYQKVAVQQRRDPVLVTTSGPDRVLVQCFPIPPEGGTMRVRLGITAPLGLPKDDQAILSWPHFVERNFGIRRDFGHGVWLETPSEVLRLPEDLVSAPGENGRSGYHGEWSESELSSYTRTLALRRNPERREVWAPDRRSPTGGHVRQWLERGNAVVPTRVALVLDGSAGMDEVFNEVASAVEGMPAAPELAVFVAQDGVLCTYTGRDGAASAVDVRRIKGVGGQDCVPALVRAWEWAAAGSGGVVCWVHGPQPVLLSPVDPLRQRLEWRNGAGAPRFVDVATQPGPNRVLDGLDGIESVSVLPRFGKLSDDLGRWFATWSGREPVWTIRREHADILPVATVAALQTASHVTRLWAAEESRRLWRERRTSPARELGARHQLVTPATGAVVLETQQQYAEAGLQPVDAATVPVVPEPGSGSLLILGAAVVLWFKRGGRARIERRMAPPRWP